MSARAPSVPTCSQHPAGSADLCRSGSPTSSSSVCTRRSAWAPTRSNARRSPTPASACLPSRAPDPNGTCVTPSPLSRPAYASSGKHGRVAQRVRAVCVEHWFKEAVIYCVDVETFVDSDGDGWGDLQGLISRLDHFARLGVTTLWLDPLHT